MKTLNFLKTFMIISGGIVLILHTGGGDDAGNEKWSCVLCHCV